jgi:putative hydrolase of the HAD superfamily
MERKSRAVIFDGDDTLWHSQIHFDQAKAIFYDLLAAKDLDRAEVAAVLAQIDMANVARLAFSPDRFPLSLQQTYRHLAQSHGQAVDKVLLARIGDLGRAVNDSSPELVDDARSVLERLRMNYELHLYTAGDEVVQRRKIEVLGIVRYFSSITIADRKSVDGLQTILQQQNLTPSTTWAVGNSLRSDISPALALGLPCVWVEGAAWEYDAYPLPTSQFWRVTSLSQVPSLMEELDELAKSP